jgi:hypothetical protein
MSASGFMLRANSVLTGAEKLFEATKISLQSIWFGVEMWKVSTEPAHPRKIAIMPE